MFSASLLVSSFFLDRISFVCVCVFSKKLNIRSYIFIRYVFNMIKKFCRKSFVFAGTFEIFCQIEKSSGSVNYRN